MLSVQDNETLCRVGPDTPMGRMMRRFWVPACLSRQLPAPDGDPLRVQLLGENFVAFRDSAGKVGLLGEYCMHRRASLALGRVEEGGLRCLLHGWKFTADGTILETPNVCDAGFAKRLKQPAYPVREAGGFVWTYIGPPELEPPFQRYAFMDMPPSHVEILRVNTPVNYLQLYEGGTDSAHVGILHMNMMNPGWGDQKEAAKKPTGAGLGAVKPGHGGKLSNQTEKFVSAELFGTTPDLEIEDTEYGYHYAALRQGPPAADGGPTHSVRITPIMFPFGRMIPANAFLFYVFEIPRHDTATSTYILFGGDEPLVREELITMMGLDDERFWNDFTGDFRASWDDGMGQDRTNMDKNWSGYRGIAQEDAIIGMAMEPVVDRSKEYVVPSDEAVIRLRRRLLESVQRHEAGEDPIALRVTDYSKVEALADTVIPVGARWQDLAPHNMGVGKTKGRNKARKRQNVDA
jgi:nitrite reductase/ring-hydroxylating ferredoxin subunit